MNKLLVFIENSNLFVFPVDSVIISQACRAKFLQPVEPFLLKVVQTYEMMIACHGFMLVGEPFGGKTCTLKVRI
jgi:dynein heavy chain